MAQKKQSSYLYNARQSLKNIGTSTLNDYLPNTVDAVGTVREGFKSATDVGDSRIGFNIIKSRIASNPLIEFGHTFVTNAYKGIKTGKFYQSTDEAFGLDIDNSSFDMDNFIIDLDDDEVLDSYQPSDTSSETDADIAEQTTRGIQGTISAGDQAVISATIETSKANASSIANSFMIGLTDLKGSLKQMNTTIAASVSASDDTNKLLSNALNVQTESLVELKAFSARFSDYSMAVDTNNKNGMDEDTANGAKKWFNDLKYGDTKNGLGELAKGITRSIDNQKSQGVMTQLMSMIPMLVTMYGTNPFGAIKDLFIMPKIDEKYGLKNLTTKIESVVSDIPTMINKQFKTMSLSDNALVRGIGEDMKNTPDMNASISTSKYTKGRVFFDGVTKEAIINVIPTHLASIVSLLSGKERTTYNYEKGKFQTLSDAKNSFKEYMPKLDYDYSDLSNTIKEFLPDEDKKNVNIDTLDNFAKTLMERLSERGYDLSDIKNMDYDKLTNITGIDRRNIDESDYVKIKTAITTAEKDPYSFSTIKTLNRKINNYITEKQKYLKDQASSIRTSGLVPTLNHSELLDSGAVTGLGNSLINNITNTSGTTGKVAGRFNYTNLLSDIDDGRDYNDAFRDLSDTDRASKRSIISDKLSDDDLKLVDEYNKKKLSGINKFKGNLKHSAQLIMSSKFFNNDDMNKEEWFKEFQSKSDYNHQDILFLMKKKEEAKAKAKKAGIEYEDEDDKGFFERLDLSKLKKRVSKNMSKMTAEFKEGSSDVLGELYTYYDKHTEGVKKFAKGTAIGLGGLGIAHALKGTGIGKYIGALGIMSPLGLATAGIGAGLYTNRKKIMDAIVGTEENRTEYAKRNVKAMKASAISAVGLGVGSGALSLISGGALGMLGPVGLAVGGLAMGISSQSSKFNEILFGDGESSFSQNLKNWLFGSKEDKKGLLSGKMGEIKTTFKKLGKNLEGWFKTQIGYPVRDIYKTLSVTAGNIIQKLGSKLSGIPMQVGLGVSAAISRSVGQPLTKYLNKMFSPIGRIFSSLFKNVTNLAGGVISAPIKLARTIITGKTDDSSYAERFYGKKYSELGKKEKLQLHKEQEMNVDVQKSTSLKDAESKATNKSERKKIRKLYTSKLTGVENPNAEDEEAGKGIPSRISKRYYYNQSSPSYTKMSFSSGKSISTHGCGLMVMAQALSIASGQRIKPEHILTESSKYQHDDDGLPRDFFSHICDLYDIPHAVYNAPNESLIRNALSQGATVIMDMKDVEADVPHYVLITDVTKNGEFVYSDPARKANMTLPCAVMIAKARTLFAIVVFKQGKLKNTIAKSEAMVQLDPKKAIIMGMRGQTIPEQNPIKFKSNKPVSQRSKHVNVINDVYDTSGITNVKLDKSHLTGYRNKRILKENATNKALDKLEEDKYIRKIYGEVRKIRSANDNNREKIEDTIDISTTGVAYNLEYIRRILVKKHGTIDDKDIDGSTGIIDALNRYKGKVGKRIKRNISRAKNFVKDTVGLIYDNTIGMVKRIGINVTKMLRAKIDWIGTTIHKVLMIPKKVLSKVVKNFSKFGEGLLKVTKAMIPSRKNIVNAYEFMRTLTTRIYDGTTNLLKDMRKGAITVMSDVRAGLLSVTKLAVDGVSNVVKFGMNAMKGAYGLIKSGFNMFAKTKLGQTLLHPIQTGKTILSAVKKKVEINLAPREVFVTGGTLNTVQTVETVKAVGAVDLDYAESIHKKTKSSEKEVFSKIKQKKEVTKTEAIKSSPKMKQGAEYHKIDERQDNISTSRAMVAYTDESSKNTVAKSSRLSDIIMGGAVGSAVKSGATAAAGILTGVASGIGLLSWTKTGKDAMKTGYDILGFNGELDSESVKEKAPRKLVKGALLGAVKTGKKIASSVTKIAHTKYIAKGINAIKNGVLKNSKIYAGKAMKNLVKDVPSKIVTFLKNIFTSKLMRKIIPDKFLVRLLEVIPRIAKQCAKRSSKAMGKAGARLGAYAFPPLGVIVDIGFAVYDMVSGLRHAGDYFELANGSHPTLGMRITAGIVNTLLGFAAGKFPPLALIPVDFLTSVVYGAITGDDSPEGYIPKEDKDNIMPSTSTTTAQPYKQNITTATSIGLPKTTVSLPSTYTAKVPSIPKKPSMLSGFGAGPKEAMNDNETIIKHNGWLEGLNLDHLFGNDKKDKVDVTPSTPSIPKESKTVSIGKYNIKNPEDLHRTHNYIEDAYNKSIADKSMGIAWAESNWRPHIKNRIGAEGLFQVLKSYRPAWGFKKTESPMTMSALEQAKRVVPKIVDKVKRKHADMDLTNMYSALHYPVAVGKPDNYVLYGKHKSPKAYRYNKGIDISFGNNDGNVSKNELGAFVKNKTRVAMDLLPQLHTVQDKAFISQKYGRYNMLDVGPMKFKEAGCGPAVLGMLLNTLNIKFDMKKLVQRAMKSTESPYDGTPINYFTETLSKFGIIAKVVKKQLVTTIINELKGGRCPIILTKNASGSNHYILGRKLDGEKIVISDPEKRKSETVDIMDRRIRNAMAVVVYVGNNNVAREKTFTEGFYSGFGNMSSLINGLSKGALDIDKLSSNATTLLNNTLDPSIATAKAKSIVNNITTPYTDGVHSMLDEASKKRAEAKHIAATVSSTKNTVVSSAQDLVKSVQDATDVNRIKHDVKSNINRLPQNINKIASPQHKDSKSTIIKQDNSEVVTRLDTIIKLLTQFVDKGLKLDKTPSPLLVNNKKVYETHSGKAKPVSIDPELNFDNGDSDAWFKMVFKLAQGS